MMPKIAQVQAVLKSRGLHGLLVSQPENRRYLSGYSAADVSIAESAGALLVPAGGSPFLLTDFRYQLQAEEEASGFDVLVYKRGLLAKLKKLLPAMGIRRLAIESNYLLHSTFVALAKTAKSIGVEPVPTSGVVEKLRCIKSEEELAKIRQAVLLNEDVFQEAHRWLRPGRTEKEVAQRIELLMKARGAEGPCFATIVAAGPNAALPHAVPGKRALQKGEALIIDMGLRLDGYCSDMTRTVVLGRPDRRTRELLRLVRKAQLAGMRKIRAGVAAQEVDRAARQVIATAGFGGNFGHGLGHGVGLAVHEAPAINQRNRKKLLAGMVVTVEPGVYIPGWGGVRLENMVVVREKGCEVLNRDKTFLDL